MKLLSYLLVFLLIPVAFAATFTDTLDADFSAGTLVNTNVSSDTVVLNISTAYVSSGNFTSQTFDLGSNPNGTISWGITTPASTSILISTRSGNGSTWSSWSSDYGSSGAVITSPMNRYYQYRVQFVTTDNTTTPTLSDVTITSAELDTNITKVSGNITANSTGSYNFQVYVSDTLQILNVSGRYSIGSGAFSTAVQLSTIAADTYNLTIPDPTWNGYNNTNITLEVTVLKTNGSVNTTTAANVTELIDFINSAPIIDPIGNHSTPQGTNLNFTVTGTDVNNHTITYTTNVTNVTVTALTSTTARLSWTPLATDIGYHVITVTANDGYTTAARNYTVNVTDIDDAPTLSSVAALTGYHGIRMAVILTGYDPDNGTNLTFSMSPPFFSIATASNSSGGYFFGVANFTPADPEKGTNNITFYVSDGTNTANTSTTLTINYCGDNVCDATYESEISCAIDCVSQAPLESISLIVPDRNCANVSMQIRTFNATNRFSCYYQGLVQEGLALCTALESVSIDVYERNGTMLTSLTTLTTDSLGSVNFTPVRAGEYKFSASKEDFTNTSAIVYVRTCDQDIVIRETNVTIEQPALPPIEEKPTAERPTEETPGNLQEEASLLQAMLFYVVVPLLMAMLLYAGSVFYDVNKDTLPWILESRIMMHEQRIKYKPQIEALKQKTAPIVAPVTDALVAIYEASLKPIIEKIKGKK